jgi:hypothetical protein
MGLIKLLGLVWLCLIFLFVIFFTVGVLIENNLSEEHPIMKWWRKHIMAPDPEDNWKNIQH